MNRYPGPEAVGLAGCAVGEMKKPTRRNGWASWEAVQSTRAGRGAGAAGGGRADSGLAGVTFFGGVEPGVGVVAFGVVPGFGFGVVVPGVGVGVTVPGTTGIVCGGIGCGFR